MNPYIIAIVGCLLVAEAEPAYQIAYLCLTWLALGVWTARLPR